MLSELCWVWYHADKNVWQPQLLFGNDHDWPTVFVLRRDAQATYIVKNITTAPSAVGNPSASGLLSMSVERLMTLWVCEESPRAPQAPLECLWNVLGRPQDFSARLELPQQVPRRLWAHIEMAECRNGGASFPLCPSNGTKF